MYMVNVSLLRKKRRLLCGESRAVSGSIDFEGITDLVGDYISMLEDEKHLDELKKKIEERKRKISKYDL